MQRYRTKPSATEFVEAIKLGEEFICQPVTGLGQLAGNPYPLDAQAFAAKFEALPARKARKKKAASA